MLLAQAPLDDTLRDPVLHSRHTERAKPKQDDDNPSKQHPDNELAHSGTFRVTPLVETTALSPVGESRRIKRSAQCAGPNRISIIQGDT
jgi:hypothetical protein